MKLTSLFSFLKTQKDFLFVFFILGLLFIIFLGERPFATPDEARYVEIPKEMLFHKDFITPRLNGVKYFEKPPFLYWLQTLSLALFGLKEWAMRLWIAIFAFIGCLTVFFLGQRFYNRKTGLLAALILGVCPLYFAMSQLIILDMAVSVFCTLTSAMFLFAIEEKENFVKRRLFFYAFSFFCACGILTKGIMCLAIPGPVIVLWLTLTRQWTQLRPFYPFTCLIIFLAVAAPWHILAQWQNPEFLYKYIYVEHFIRFTTSYHARTKPIWFFVPIIIVGFIPWIVFLWNACRHAITNRINLFFSLQSLWIFIFFSFSNSKLIPYILPAFPFLALLVSHYIYTKGISKNEKISLYIFHGILALIGSFALYAKVAFNVDWIPLELVPSIIALTLIFAGTIIILSLNHYFKTPIERILIIENIALIFVLMSASTHIQKPSIKPLIPVLRNYFKQGDEVISYHTYYQDLPVYWNGFVSVADYTGELGFGVEQEDVSNRFYGEKIFAQRWYSQKRLWVFVPKKEWNQFAKNYPIAYIINSNKATYLVTNHPLHLSSKHTFKENLS